MNVAISGAGGLVGRALRANMQTAGYKVRAIVRAAPNQAASQNEVRWDIHARRVEASKLDAMDVIIHLAGEPVADGKWTAKKKAAIRDSRVKSTALLAEVIAKLPNPPKLLLSASAIGYYGDRGDQVLTEEAEPGKGFLAETCVEWEAATKPAEQRGVRVVHLRTGVVLDKGGGALAKMLGVFRMGLGGKIGSGEQYMSWISLADEVRAIEHCIEDRRVRGPVNLVGPRPVTNLQFTRTLGDVLGRPTFMRVPAFATKMMFGGEMARELLLASTRCEPAKLRDNGFRFNHGDIEGAIRSALK